MYNLVKPLLFRLDAETSHNLVMGTLALGSKYPLFGKLLSTASASKFVSAPLTVMGLRFPNPVGLAPGLDKHATAANMFHRLGFGFVELGTVTPLPQPGNPRPRIFRLKEHQAIINRMGFNSVGVETFLRNASSIQPRIIKGINIGKNAATPMAKANEDYRIGLRAVYSHADYVTINISSPNTKNLRELQSDEALESLLKDLHLERLKLTEAKGKRVPLVIKIGPDIDTDQISTIATLARKYDIDGIAATNTTIERSAVKSDPQSMETGGLSGPPLRQRSTEVIQALSQNLQGEVAIIGLGGIQDSDSAIEKFQAGAELVQIYTGFIYHGPKLIGKIVDGYRKQFS
jgi:dihydroorotate dehydrogenase